MDYRIRTMKESEYPLLKDFTYESIFVPEGVEPPPRSVLNAPELQVYTAGFGSKPHDVALVAEVDGKAVGAVWARIMNDFGHIDDETPSLAISLYREYRGFGIGTQMMKAILAVLKEREYKQVSLSCQKANYAVKMYRKVGFETVDENEEEFIMLNRL